MMRGMFAAISGLKNHQTMLDVTANDIANVNTIGYNVVFLPLANRLKELSEAELHFREMTLEGILAIQAGDNPASSRRS